MEDMLESLGVLGLMDPLTALDLRDRMRASGVPDATVDQVNQAWAAYQDAILEKKLQPFTKDADWVPTFNDLVAVTQLPKMTVSAFLTALRAHAADHATMQYLDPAQGQASRDKAAETAKEILSLPGKVLKTASQPVIDTAAAAGDAISTPLKWTAIGLAGVAVIYLAFQAAPFLTAARKTKKKKKG